MNPEPDPVESLFASALDRPVDQRAAYLAEACRGDDALRERVEALLKAHAEAGGEAFLTGPYQGQAQMRPAEGPGTRIGPYKLLQQIGEGGMGVVWMAEQTEPVRRRIALKIIKPGMDSAQIVARFEAERQALAMMDHPNIAKVLDAGTTQSGRPYFVMDLVKGVPLTRFCDENKLTPRERLELFIPVCQAIQHAHQKGIVHRDVKPSNVLVTLYDGRPVPKVIDFGVAKALHQPLTERTMFTAFGTLIGTLEYMAPEQAELNALDVDTRSDVYSLGVLLYELLTGSTPLSRKRLREAAHDEVLRLIREEEPPRPSTRLSESREQLPTISAQRRTEPAKLARLMRGELDWIVMKALEKERNRRYETASGLARDIERYLHDEPVEACPPSVGYRLTKFARKHRGVLVTATAFALLLMTAAAVSTWLAYWATWAEADATRERNDAIAAGKDLVDERDRADRAARTATTKARETRQALDRLSVEQGLRLAGNDDLFTALLWFAKPLERRELSKEEERVHRTRFACYLRHTHGRQVLRQMFFHDGNARQLTFSPDATELLMATDEGVHIWDLNTGRKVATLEQSKGLEQVRFMSGNRASALVGSAVHIWDTTTGRLRARHVMESEPISQVMLTVLSHSPWQALGSVAVSRLLAPEAILSLDGGLHMRVLGNHAWLCDVSTGKRRKHWSSPAPDENVRSAFSADSHHVLTWTKKRAEVYDVITSKPFGPALAPRAEITNAQISSDGTRVAVETSEGVAVWNSISGKQVGPTLPESCTLSPDGRIFALSEGFGFPMPAAFSLIDAGNGRPIMFQSDKRYQGPCCFSPDGCNVIGTGKDQADELWDAHTGRAAGPLLPNPGVKPLYSFTLDCSMLAVAHGNGIVRIWCLAGYVNGRRDGGSNSEPLPQEVDHFTFSFASWQQGGKYSLPGASPGKKLSELRDLLKSLPPSIPDACVCAAISPDRHRLVTITEKQDSKPVLWDATTGRRLGPLEQFLTLSFSANSQVIVTANNPGPARLWDAQTGKPIVLPFEHGEGINHARLAPDGSRLVTCSTDGTAQIWETATAKPIGTRLRHADAINAVRFSPNGRHVATASSDGTARLWDSATGRSIGRALTHKNGLIHIVFDRRGELLLTQQFQVGSSDWVYRYRIWDVATQQEVSPNITLFRGPIAFEGLGARWDADSLFVPHDPWARSGMRCDMSPDLRRVEDLVKLARLHTGQRLDDLGNLVPLSKAELQALWNELRREYPDEFTVRPEAVMAWHVERIQTLAQHEGVSRDRVEPAIRMHRKALAAQMIAANWHEDLSHWGKSGWCRLEADAQYGRPKEAVATVEALAARGWLAASEIEAVRIYALAAGAVKAEPPLAERYARRAIALLHQAVAAGYKDAVHLKKDPDLDSLRGRDDFGKLLKELDAKNPK